MPAKNFIVAIELGSTKITGVAGSKNPDGSFTVNAVAKEDATACIRKGVVYNSDKTIQCINNIINRLQKAMKTEIAQVYVGVGGQSIYSDCNTINKEMPDATQVTQDTVVELMDKNRAMQYKDMEILDVVTQEYKVDSQYQLEPVGIECKHLEGNFLNILQSRKHYHSLNNCFDKAGVAIAEMYLAPFALADGVLTDAEKRSGCMLVDLGAETTTVLVYHKNLLRHMAVIPLGSNNITKDITTLQLEDSDAEVLKLRYASAYTDFSDIDSTMMYSIDKDRQIESRRFIEIVEARVQEIVQNVWNQVPMELASKLVGGIILTGGGSNMRNITTAFRNHTHIEKIRIAQSVNYIIHSSNADATAKNGQMNTVLGLLAKGEINCAGNEIIEQKDIFVQEEKPALFPDQAKEGQQGTGRVPTAEEKAKAEEEARKKAEEEAAEQARIEQEERERLEAERKKAPGLATKISKWLADIFRAEEE